MEVNKADNINNKIFWRHLLSVMVLLFLSTNGFGQPPIKAFVVKQGKIYVTLSKNISTEVLDEFIDQYDLQELDLKTFVRTSRPDSLKKLGWSVELNNNEMIVLAKLMKAANKSPDAVDKILLAQKNYDNGNISLKAPVFGYNRFTKKYPFAVRDSAVTFFYRGASTANKVMLAGTFNNWDPEALAMKEVDSGWIAAVKLGPGKHYYKFIVDGNWTIDKENQLVENDGRGNNNSVYYKSNYLFSLAGNQNARNVYVAGSFNNWDPRGMKMAKTASGWKAAVFLGEGTHTYRYVVDGRWMADPGNPDQFPNEFNETNSVIQIGRPYQFFLPGYLNARQVMLMGSFNQWRNYELRMKRTDSGWVLPYVLGHGNYQYGFEVDGKKPTDPATGKTMAIKSLIFAPNHTFKLSGFEKARSVFISGDFNNWSPNGFAMTRKGNEWVLPQHLAPGKHVYKFVVDAQWMIDPANKLREPNEFGQENSVIWIEHP
ncbi:MAG: hypothetical protein V4725_18645 [Bacteroidota bacterium]